MRRLHVLLPLMLCVLLAGSCTTPPPATPAPCPKQQPCRVEKWNFVNEQDLLFTGPTKNIDEVFRRLQQKWGGSALFDDKNPRRSVFLGDLVNADKVAESPRLPESWGADLEIRPRTLAARADMSAVLKSAMEVMSQDPAITDVAVEPNFATTLGYTASPWVIEGSPWVIEGSAALPATEADSGYWEQWALTGDEGIAPNAAFPLTYTAESDVVVAIFDTLPPLKSSTIGWVTPPLILRTIPAPEPIKVKPASPQTCAPDVSDHGLFVAGLVHAVTARRGADRQRVAIELYEVLDKNGRGDALTLIQQLVTFANERRAKNGNLKQTVINLSLGSANPKDTLLPADAADFFLDKSGYETIAFTRSATSLPVIGLDTVMRLLHDNGALIVASSGNGSADDPAHPLGPEIPAAYCPVVVGVSAADPLSERACFSNTASTQAPGGDGWESGGKCESGLCTCDPKAAGKCPYGVVSLTTDRGRPGREGFALWAGSSFAAPLASGSLALALTTGQPLPAWYARMKCPSPGAPGPFVAVTTE